MAMVYKNGGNGNDVIDSSTSVDPVQVQGRLGDDTVTGSNFNDKLFGNEGNDVLAGGLGADSLSGGTGADTYVIARSDLGTSKDSLLDFEGAGNGALSTDDVISFTGFSAAATLTFVRQSGKEFIYLVKDGDAQGEIAVTHAADVRLTWGDYIFVGQAAPNRAPVLTGTQTPLTGQEDTPYILTAASLLEGFTDADSDTLSVTGLSVANAILLDNGDGSWTVTPVLNRTQPLTFSYSVSDGRGGNTAATRTLTLEAVNDAPLAVADAALVLGIGPRTINLSTASLLANDIDIDFDTLTITGVDAAANGLLTLNDNGTAEDFSDDFVTYTPNFGYFGIEVLTYTISDGTTTVTGTLNVVVQPEIIIPTDNHAPELTGTQTPLANGAEDTAYVLTAAALLEGYTDPDGDALVVANLTVSSGALTDNGDGTWTITPVANASGTLTLNYDVVDPYGASVAATRSLDINAVNDAPVAGTDTATVTTAGPRTITLTAASLLANDTDIDGGTLHIVGVGTAAHGTLTLNTNGTPSDFSDDFITYTPVVGYAGADTFTYTLSDGSASVFGTVNVTVQAAVVPITYVNGGNGNDVLSAAGQYGPYQIQGRVGNDTVTGGNGNDKLYGNEGNDSLTGGTGTDTFSGGAGTDTYLINKADLIAGGTENILDFEGVGDGATSGDLLQLGGFNPGASLVFIRQSGNDHTYEVRDGSYVATLKIAYSGTTLLTAGDYVFLAPEVPNNAPVASGTPAPLTHGTEDVDYTITTATLLDGITDPDGDTLTVTGLSMTHGTIENLGGGNWMVQPDDDYHGEVTLSYTVEDGRGGSIAATRTLTFDPVNDAPILSGARTPMPRGAVDTDYELAATKLLEGFTDIDGDALSVTGLTASHGTLTEVEGGYTLSFEPGFVGSVTLTYSVSDGHGGNTATTRNVSIGGSNTPPVATDTEIETHTNGIISGQLAVTDTEGDTVTFSVFAGAANGTLKLAADGTYTYAPDAGFTGTDNFIITLDDGHDGVTQQIFTVEVAASSADPTPWRDTGAAGAQVFIQRDGTTGSFYVQAEQARVTKGGVVIADWTDTGVILDIPQGDGYVLETKTGGVTTTRPLAIGEVIVAAGQSNMEGWFTESGPSRAPESGIYQWTATNSATAGHWVSATGGGALAFAETLRLAERGLPIAYITGAVGGTSLTQVNDRPYWMATGSGSLYQNLVNQVKEATHGQSALLLWNQGEADSAVRVDPTAYANAMTTLFGRFDAEFAPEKILIAGLAFTRGNADALRAAQASVAAASAGHVLYVPTTPAIETTDLTHLTVPARILQATVDALVYLADKGITVPEIAQITGTTAGELHTGSALLDIIQAGAGNDSVTGEDGDDIVRGETGSDVIAGNAGDDALSGGADNDSVDGGDGNDDVFGDDGNDTLAGGLGNDLLDGGFGNDVMEGQAGNDIYIIDSASDVVTEAADGGTDILYIRTHYTLGDNIENLFVDSGEAVNGTGNALNNMMTGGNGANLLSGLGGNDNINGGPGNDTLEGGDGNDTLTGGSGNDLQKGGTGDDTYYVDALDTVWEAADEGYDTIITQVAFTLPDHVEAIILGGKNAIGVTGSAGDNAITGNGSANILDGAGGNDNINGLAGNDVLNGGEGNDSLLGGEGSDNIKGGMGVDTLTGDTPTKRSGDTFVFDSIAHIGLGAGNHDIITDFDANDVFDVRAIDANIEVADDQAFTFIGTGAFTAAGQIRYTVVGSEVIVEFNVDSDLGADAQISLTSPLVNPTLGDFLL